MALCVAAGADQGHAKCAVDRQVLHAQCAGLGLVRRGFHPRAPLDLLDLLLTIRIYPVRGLFTHPGGAVPSLADSASLR